MRWRMRFGIGAALLAVLADPAHALISGSGTATIDGVIGQSEWDGAGTRLFDVKVTASETVQASLRVMNDGNNLYFALQVADDTASVYDVSLEFDVDGNDTASAGDDGIGLSSNGSPRDGVRLAASFPSDISQGGTIDVQGAFVQADSHSTFELSHPLSGDGNRDIDVGTGQLIPFFLSINIFAPTGTASYYPGPFAFDYEDIEIVPEAALLEQVAVACALLAGIARKRSS